MNQKKKVSQKHSLDFTLQFLANSWCLLCSQQSITVVVIEVISHPPDLIFLVGIPSTSEDVGSRFILGRYFAKPTGRMVASPSE